MLSGTEARIRYLSVAFFAQGVLDALAKFAQSGSAVGLDATLATAIRELGAATGTQPAERRPGDVRAFRNYEQVRTLDEVSNQAGIQKIIHILEDLLERRNTGHIAEQRRELNDAIDFFFHLESHALRNFDQPIESLPSGMRELCKAS